MHPKYPKQEVGNIFGKSVAAAFVFYCDPKQSDILRGSSPVYCYIIIPLHSQTRNFLPKHHNAIIKEHLCVEGQPSLLPLLQVDVFRQKQGIFQQIILCPSSKPKKACIRLFDTNNFTQGLTRKNRHIGTESLYRLCDEKISWTPSRSVLSIWLCSFSHLSAMQDLWIIRFFYFSHEVSHHKVRKVTEPKL